MSTGEEVWRNWGMGSWQAGEEKEVGQGSGGERREWLVDGVVGGKAWTRGGGVGGVKIWEEVAGEEEESY